MKHFIRYYLAAGLAGMTILFAAGCAREDVLYVGDSDVDMQTAKNAGVRVCGVLWGFRTREVLAEYQPDYLTATPNEILDMVM